MFRINKDINSEHRDAPLMESEPHSQMTPALDRPDSWSPRGIYKATREEYLNEAAIIMQPWLNVHITPQRVRDHNKDRIVEKKKLRPFKQGCCSLTCARCENKIDYRANGILGRYYHGVKGSKPQIYVTDQKARPRHKGREHRCLRDPAS